MTRRSEQDQVLSTAGGDLPDEVVTLLAACRNARRFRSVLRKSMLAT